MQVSVIIVNYNTFQLTCNCIKSIIRHTQAIKYEIILVDNGSTECDADLFTAQFPTINLLKNTVNTGFAGGNNCGIRYAKGEVILLLNSDTELTENSIAICYTYLKENPMAAVVSPMLIYPDGAIQPQCQRFPSIKLELIELFRLHKLLSHNARGRLLLSTFFSHQVSIKPDWLWGTFFMFNQSVLNLFNDRLLPADFFMYGEDKQWCLELRRHNKEVHYYPVTKVIHHVGSSFYNNQPLAKIEVIRNHEKLLVKKYYGNYYWTILKWIQLFKYTTLWIKNKEYGKYIKIIYSI